MLKIDEQTSESDDTYDVPTEKFDRARLTPVVPVTLPCGSARSINSFAPQIGYPATLPKSWKASNTPESHTMNGTHDTRLPNDSRRTASKNSNNTVRANLCFPNPILVLRQDLFNQASPLGAVMLQYPVLNTRLKFLDAFRVIKQ